MPDVTSEIVSNLSTNASDVATQVFQNPSVADMLTNPSNPINQTNTTGTSGAIFANFSWQALVIFIVLVIAVVVLIIFALKRPKSNNTNSNSSGSYLKALVITLTLALLIFFMEGMGWLNEGTTKWGIFFFIGLFFVLVWRFNKNKNPMLELITKKYVEVIRRHLLEMYDSELIVGNQFGKQIHAFTVKINQGEYGGGDTDVVHYLVLTGNHDYFAITIGLQSGAILDTIVDPSQEYREKMWRVMPKAARSPNQQSATDTQPQKQSNQPTPQNVPS